MQKMALTLACVLALAACKEETAAPAPAPSQSISNSPALQRTTTMNHGTVVIIGRDMADLLNGTDGADHIEGNGGNDVINGGLGADEILGGDGNDVIYGEGSLPDQNDPLIPPLPNPAPPGPDYHPTGNGWSLVWSDEFDGTSLDPAKWAPEVSCWGGGNNERQCYTDREENVEVVNGLLRLIARKETFTGPYAPPEWNDPDPQATQPYTSGKVRSRGLADWKYGRFEVRAKIPAGQGAWPAIWMLPIEEHYGTWPLSGEIDIMEAVNIGAFCSDCGGSGENRTSSALHFGDVWPGNQYADQKNTLAGGEDPSLGYHVYAAEWAEGVIHFFVDDQLYFTMRAANWYTTASNASGNPNAPFDRPFYLMMNFAVGGNWPEGANDLGVDETAFPNQFLIDWVRVYQCTGDATGQACLSVN